MVKRTVDGKRLTRWGNGRDMYAKPNVKMRKVLSDAVDDGAVIMVWTETHLDGDELDAARGHLHRRGWDTEATAAYLTEMGRRRGRRNAQRGRRQQRTAQRETQWPTRRSGRRTGRRATTRRDERERRGRETGAG